MPSADDSWTRDLGHLRALAHGAVVADLGGRILLVNAAAVRLFGRAEASLLGSPVTDVFCAEHLDVVREVARSAAGGGAWTGDLSVQCEGGPVHVSVDCTAVQHAGATVGTAYFLTSGHVADEEAAATRRTAERLAGLARVTADLATAQDLETVTSVLISRAAEVVGATVGALTLRTDDDTLAMVGIRGGLEGAAERWVRFSLHDSTPVGDVVRSGEMLVMTGQEEVARRYPDLERAIEGERSMVVLPLRESGRTIGAVSWSFPGLRTVTGAEVEFFGILADSCAQAIARIGAREESERQAARVQFLADATSTLSERLDYAGTLADVARMVVPEFADWCAIDLVDDDRLHRLAVEHIDPAKVALAVELERRWPAERNDQSGAWQVVRTGETTLVPEVTDEMIEAGIEDEERRALMLELKLRSVLLVPLVARGKVLGVMTWVMAESDRRYTEGDLAFAEDLGRRAGLAIDNSRLHTETLEAAVRLQHAVLPDLPDQLPGWDLASYYSQAGSTEVGGDFFDVVALADGRIAVFVGDVMGRGVHAAAAMAEVRAAVRAYTAVDPAPSLVMNKMDLLFETFDVSRFVTMLYLVADPHLDEVTMVNAGHPPPVVLRADGSVEQVPLTGDVPLGTLVEERVESTFALRPGDLLIAFTDGLIERRDEDIDVGQQRLLDAVPLLGSGPLDVALDEVVARTHDERRSDDIAALVVRRQLG